jgi:hypothetical protein
VKALPGTHTFVPQSPPPKPGDPPSKLVTVSADGNTLTYEGNAYAHNGGVSPDHYQARIPPLLGPWQIVRLTEGEAFNVYEVREDGSPLWIEQGRDYYNG